ncbi:MAG: lysophospholipid acyltransferase family protein [Steroidobacteraceae bacterium]
MIGAGSEPREAGAQGVVLVRPRHFVETLMFYGSLTLLGAICLSWTVLALPLLLVLPAGPGRRCGRLGILVGFRLYVWSLGLMGAYRLDLRALRALRDGPAVVLAPNHPTLIDALLIIAHEPRVACVMKSSLMNNLFLGAWARLARYIRSDPPRHMIHEAGAELRRGGIVLLFPEGTRTTQSPINALQAGVGIIARQAGVAVQTLIIETDSPYLSKGWSLFRRPSMPINYRVRLGRRLDPPGDVREFTAQLDRYFRAELADAPQNRWLEARARPGPSAVH